MYIDGVKGTSSVYEDASIIDYQGNYSGFVFDKGGIDFEARYVQFENA